MTTLLSPDDLRLAFETDLGDAVLQLIIDDADEAIISRFGDHDGASPDGLLTEELYGGGLNLFLRRRASSVYSVTEYQPAPFSFTNEDTGTVLDANDYLLIHEGRTLRRLVIGAHPPLYWGRSVAGSSGPTADNPFGIVWGWRVVVEYAPVSQDKRRARVELDLCRLALTYKGLIKSERAGDYSNSGASDPLAYQREREVLLSELLPAGGVAFA